MGPVSEKGVATPPPQTMSIEAGAGMKGESEKEWYYMTRERERVGPFSFQEVSRLPLPPAMGEPPITSQTPPLPRPHR